MIEIIKKLATTLHKVKKPSREYFTLNLRAWSRFPVACYSFYLVRAAISLRSILKSNARFKVKTLSADSLKFLVQVFIFSWLLGSFSSAQNNGVEIAPTWETQSQARKFLLGIPAPRGQITDRNGKPLVQNRVSQNLAIVFPTPLNFNDVQVLQYVHEKIAEAERLLSKRIVLNDSSIVKYYKNRGLLPMEILQDLLPPEVEKLANLPEGLTLRSTYQRFYPNGSFAGHILGYCGRRSGFPDRPIQNNDLLWPDTEGREGLEKMFDRQLSGSIGQMNFTFDEAGNKSSEVISIPPEPGLNVITTLDEDIQRKCEEILAKHTRRGAIVVMDPRNGDILALASWPTFNPNDFVPVISQERFNQLQNDSDVPLLPRAFRSAYPPGSTFKIITGLAAFEKGAITPDSTFSCPPSFSLGKFTFRNWKKSDAGYLNFVEALTQSCNTWFYQVSLKTGGTQIIQWAHSLGLGQKTGIPLEAESSGNIPDDEYMLRKHNRRVLDGDVVNMSIGQGDILATPLQMAQAMMIVANGGIAYQPRLVQQVQQNDGKIVTGYNVRAKANLAIHEETLRQIRKGMIGVVSGGNGTAGRARVPKVEVAGKTGTAQWGNRIAAWFVGFAPADAPEYAFAVVYEGEPGNKHIGGGSHAAPMAGDLLRDIFKNRKKQAEKETPDEQAEENADPEETPLPSETIDVDPSG